MKLLMEGLGRLGGLGRLRKVGRVGQVRQVGVRAAPAEMWDRWECELHGRLWDGWDRWDR